MRILVVEDDRMVSQAIEALLVSQRYAVDLASTGLEGLEMAENYRYDLMLLDIGLPEMDGVSLCQQIRSRGIQAPILLLTGQAADAGAKATALNAGADDYVTKPFDAEELMARLQTLMRRGALKNLPVLTWGLLSLDPSRLQVTYGETLLRFTPKEYGMLETLLRHAPNIVSTHMILEQSWDALEAPGEETVRTHIKELRRKLRAAGAPKDFIKTLHRQGYRLNPLYGEATFADEETVGSKMQMAELKAVNDELRTTLDQLQSTQSELQQRNQELQAARDELEAFSSSVSHDLQTPLRYIRSFVEKLRSHLESADVDESSRHYLSIIERAAEEASTMVDALLEFSCMGKPPLHLTPVPMAQLVEQARSHLASEMGDRPIEWHIEPLPEVQGDAALLQMVWQNLLSNAVKYTHGRPAARITIGSYPQGQDIVFFVKDNGVGFDMQYRDRLFNLFQRLHPQEEFVGNGVGLATMRRIIHRHGGQVWAEGAINQGATFYFSLPQPEVVG
jgi:DNA-binding response OmpR family regulator/nitrogen-specific signal transduction histidine kinase